MKIAKTHRIQILGLIVFMVWLSFVSPGWCLERQGMVGVGGTLLAGLATGDFGSLVESGLGPGVNIEYFMNKSLAIGANFGYMLFQSPSVVTGVCTLASCIDSTDFVWPLDQEWSMVSFGAFAKYIFHPEKNFSFYSKGGIMGNNYRIKYDRVYPPVPSDSSNFKDNTIHINVGLGMTFDYKEKVGIFAEFLYNRLLIKNLTVQYIGLNIGATLYFGGRKEK